MTTSALLVVLGLLLGVGSRGRGVDRLRLFLQAVAGANRPLLAWLAGRRARRNYQSLRGRSLPLAGGAVPHFFTSTEGTEA